MWRCAAERDHASPRFSSGCGWVSNFPFGCDVLLEAGVLPGGVDPVDTTGPDGFELIIAPHNQTRGRILELEIMRNLLIPATLALSVGLAGAAFAATAPAVGAIKAIDAKTDSITLVDGKTYVLPKGFKLSSLKVGEKVSVKWELQNGKNVASAVTPAS